MVFDMSVTVRVVEASLFIDARSVDALGDYGRSREVNRDPQWIKRVNRPSIVVSVPVSRRRYIELDHLACVVAACDAFVVESADLPESVLIGPHSCPIACVS